LEERLLLGEKIFRLEIRFGIHKVTGTSSSNEKLLAVDFFLKVASDIYAW
jgi:hypothetical protein